MNTPMNCPFARDDAAYVLGALSPASDSSSSGTWAAVTTATARYASSPVSPACSAGSTPSVLERPPADEPLPETLLPSLSREVRRAGRRRTRVAVGVAAAAAAAAAVIAAVIVAGVGSQVGDDDGRKPTSPARAPRQPGSSRRPWTRSATFPSERA